jgi:hypothetical protein
VIKPGNTVVAYEVRCDACGRLLFVAREPWQTCAVNDAEIVTICPARRGGFVCKRLIPLKRGSDGA